MRRTLLILSLVFCVSSNALALDHVPNHVYVRVVDVGAGLCCVAAMPGNHFMGYDAGDRDMPLEMSPKSFPTLPESTSWS